MATLTPLHSWFRHPSYAGFFYWALGTQLVLQNPISFAMYAVVLWRFFYYRTRGGRVFAGQCPNAHLDTQPRRSISSTSSGKSTNSTGRGSRFGYPSSLKRPSPLPFDFRQSTPTLLNILIGTVLYKLRQLDSSFLEFFGSSEMRRLHSVNA